MRYFKFIYFERCYTYFVFLFFFLFKILVHLYFKFTFKWIISFINFHLIVANDHCHFVVSFGGIFNFSTRNVELLAARAPFIFNLFFIKQFLELFFNAAPRWAPNKLVVCR